MVLKVRSMCILELNTFFFHSLQGPCHFLSDEWMDSLIQLSVELLGRRCIDFIPHSAKYVVLFAQVLIFHSFVN